MILHASTLLLIWFLLSLNSQVGLVKLKYSEFECSEVFVIIIITFIFIFYLLIQAIMRFPLKQFASSTQGGSMSAGTLRRVFVYLLLSCLHY